MPKLIKCELKDGILSLEVDVASHLIEELTRLEHENQVLKVDNENLRCTLLEPPFKVRFQKEDANVADLSTDSGGRKDPSEACEENTDKTRVNTLILQIADDPLGSDVHLSLQDWQLIRKESLDIVDPSTRLNDLKQGYVGGIFGRRIICDELKKAFMGTSGRFNPISSEACPGELCGCIGKGPLRGKGCEK